MANESATRRRAKNPVRIITSARGDRGRSRVDATIAAVSSTHPAAVTQLRAGCGERKNTSAGRLVWLSSTSMNQSSQRANSSSSMSSRNPMREYRVSSSIGDGGTPARVSSLPTSTSRRPKAA